MNTIALVVPNQQHIKEVARKLNIENVNEASYAQLYKNKLLEKAVLDELSAHGKKSKISFNSIFIIFLL